MAMALKRQSAVSMIECIENCTDCAAICEETVQHCLEAGGDHAAPDHIRLLLDCVAICRTSAGFMIRGSDLHSETCRACAETCARCAAACGQFDDEQMKACADLCRRCADSCAGMAGND